MSAKVRVVSRDQLKAGYLELIGPVAYQRPYQVVARTADGKPVVKVAQAGKERPA